jgi:GTP pyrophosphokinase
LGKGQEILNNELRKNNMPINESLSNKNVEFVLKEYKLKNINELYISIGSGKYQVASVVKLLKGKNAVIDLASKISNNYKGKDNSKNDILVEGLDDIKVNLSGCCKPIPGDKIIGYITRGSGITIHRITCSNIIELDDRLVKVRWNNTGNKKYFTDIIVHTNTSDNLLDIITRASYNNIGIDSISTINKSEYKIYSITLLVENLDKLNKFIVDLNNLPFTLKVERLK